MYEGRAFRDANAMSREAQRAPVVRAQDPLQLNLTSPETWAVPRLVDPDSAKASLRQLADKVHFLSFDV